MTEAEAKMKWCPRSLLPQPAEWNRCVGSECMAWRTTTEKKDFPVGMDPGEGWTKDGAPWGAGGAVTHRQQWTCQGGYCGLAGHPENL